MSGKPAEGGEDKGKEGGEEMVPRSQVNALERKWRLRNRKLKEQLKGGSESGEEKTPSKGKKEAKDASDSEPKADPELVALKAENRRLALRAEAMEAGINPRLLASVLEEMAEDLDGLDHAEDLKEIRRAFQDFTKVPENAGFLKTANDGTQGKTKENTGGSGRKRGDAEGTPDLASKVRSGSLSMDDFAKDPQAVFDSFKTEGGS